VARVVAGEAPPPVAGDPGSRTAVEPDGQDASAARVPTIHRVRDLGRRARLEAFAVALALLAAPVAAFAHFVPDWAATSDPALMGLRAMDVGTGRTPLLGQPSQSGLYADAVASVHHPGPIHFYLLAAPIRAFGAAIGMPLVTLLVTGSCLVIVAWVVHRLLGSRAALIAAVGLALVTFTTGAASLVNPVSSSIAGYPLLATAVLMWAVAVGDVRLLPLATAVVSFTAQQHLAAVPATLVLCVGGLGLGAFLWRRDGRSRHPANCRDLRRAATLSGIVALVLWSPVLLQQLFGNSGNLSEMFWFARHGNSETVGLGSAFRQVAHASGLPPVLGRTDATGAMMLGAPALVTWLSAAFVLVAVGVLSARHRDDRPRALLGAMVGVLVLAGLVNGSSVPEGLEKLRLTFYHWAFPLGFMIVLVLGLGATDALASARLVSRRAVRAGLAAVTVVVVASVGVISPQLDRRQNTAAAAYAAVPAWALDELADGVAEQQDALGDHTLLVSRGETVFAGISAGLALELAQRGHDVQLPLTDRFFVNDDRLVDREELDGGLVLVAESLSPRPPPPGGELIGRVEFRDDPSEAFTRLVEAAEATDEVRYGPETEAALDDVHGGDGSLRDMGESVLLSLVTNPQRSLTNATVLEVLEAGPLESPELDPDDVRAVRDTLDRLAADDVSGNVTGLRLYLLDRDEMLDFAVGSEVGRPR
jgi:hypothetical protein